MSIPEQINYLWSTFSEDFFRLSLKERGALHLYFSSFSLETRSYETKMTLILYDYARYVQA